MSNLDHPEKVLIVGAGLGGLALAQVLHNHGVPFELFERDGAPSARKQGWAVALLEAITALEELLPNETIKGINSTSVNHDTGENDEIAFVNAITGEMVGKVGGIARGVSGSIIRASRDALRAFLWRANGLPITPNKQFTRYIEDEYGVTALFADGSSSRGSLLVGADGLHSRVRKQLLGSSAQEPVQSQYVPIFGELDLPREHYEPLRRIANAVILSSAPGLRQQIGMLSMDEDRCKAHYFWALMIRCNDPIPLADWVGKATPEELYDFAVKSSRHLHPTLNGFLNYGGSQAMIQPQPKFQELVPPETFPEGRVTVLGDAAHAMIPLRGAGANTAILDACDLGKLLIKARAESRGYLSTIAPYLARMIPRGREAVLASRAAGDEDGDDPAVYLTKFKREKQQDDALGS
ncbi:hypothetical protein PMIN06_001703 [Paraphaeosphaeria minitans]|uniref:Early conidial development-2 n=1 Tax=Paraphaeosphaeria minitans TaxID=565426 RepID=A0A9P6GNJ0_9PLEO|nr:early conidial development-2 [Paraphaeosphaeria minitans]